MLIDDSYSGQPEAMKLAIRSLAKLPVQGRRIARFGENGGTRRFFPTGAY